MKMPVVSGYELLKFLSKRFGFYIIRQKGNHATITNDVRFTTIPLHEELDTGTLKSILKDAGVTRKQFLQEYKK